MLDETVPDAAPEEFPAPSLNPIPVPDAVSEMPDALPPAPDPAPEPIEAPHEAPTGAPIDNLNAVRPLASNLPVLPQGYPADWPMFRAAAGFSEDFSDIAIPAAIRETLSAEAAMGIYRIYFDGDDGPELFYVKEPKINALEELYIRVEEYEKLSEADRTSPTGMKQALSIVVPLLRRPDPITGKKKKVTLEEAGEYMTLADVHATFAKAFPASRVDAHTALTEAGIDPKA